MNAESSPSTSEKEKSEFANVTRVSSDVEPVPAADVGASLAPLTVTSTWWDAVVVPSLTTIVRLSVAWSPPSRASVSESALFRV